MKWMARCSFFIQNKQNRIPRKPKACMIAGFLLSVINLAKIYKHAIISLLDGTCIYRLLGRYLTIHGGVSGMKLIKNWGF